MTWRVSWFVMYVLCASCCVLRYEDFVDGDRIKRIYAALRPGSSALTGVLFFDSINRDKKGLNVCFCFDIVFWQCFWYCLWYCLWYCGWCMIWCLGQCLFWCMCWCGIWCMFWCAIWCILMYVLMYPLMYLLMYLRTLLPPCHTTKDYCRVWNTLRARLNSPCQNYVSSQARLAKKRNFGRENFCIAKRIPHVTIWIR